RTPILPVPCCRQAAIGKRPLQHLPEVTPESVRKDLRPCSNTGHPGATFSAQRIEKQVGRIEERVADESLRIDGQPSPLAEQDIFVMNVAMEWPHIMLRSEQPLGRCGSFKIGALNVIAPVSLGFRK